MSQKEYRPTLSQLRTFVTIAEKKHFGAAAAMLGISQPSLSQALVALEHGLGIQLVERSTRKVIVTPAGEELLPFAKTTLEASDAFLSRARGATGSLNGPLVIGMIPTAAPYILTEVIQELRENFPDLEPRFVEAQTHQLISQLREGQIDTALIAIPSEGSGTMDVPLYAERFAVAVPHDHPLAGRTDLDLKDLGSLDLLLLDDGHCLRDQVLDLCRRVEVNPNQSSSSLTRATSLTTIMQLVSAGMGSTLVPISAITSESIREGISLAYFAPDVTAERHMGLVYRSSSSRRNEFEELGKAFISAFNRAVSSADQAVGGALSSTPLQTD